MSVSIVQVLRKTNANKGVIGFMRSEQRKKFLYKNVMEKKPYETGAQSVKYSFKNFEKDMVGERRRKMSRKRPKKRNMISKTEGKTI